jgi:hypothetical protein
MIKIVHSQLDHTNSLRLLGSVVCGRHQQVVKFVGGPWPSLSVALCFKIAFSLAEENGEIRKGKKGKPAGSDLRRTCFA